MVWNCPVFECSCEFRSLELTQDNGLNFFFEILYMHFENGLYPGRWSHTEGVNQRIPIRGCLYSYISICSHVKNMGCGDNSPSGISGCAQGGRHSPYGFRVLGVKDLAFIWCIYQYYIPYEQRRLNSEVKGVKPNFYYNIVLHKCKILWGFIVVSLQTKIMKY